VAPCLSTLLLLVAVAFFTLLERKVLSYIMLRKGPNKPSFIGTITPFADALKLLSKPFIFPILGSPHLIVFSCLLSFLIPCLLFCFIYVPSLVWSFEFIVLGVLIWLSLSVYSLLSAGYGSNSKYSILGGLRSLAQCISYEVTLTTLLLCYCLFSTFRITHPQPFCFLVFHPHLCLLLFVIGLAETNRSPFDFAEGESELVSGYNVEYSGPGFVVLFLSEYLSILWMSSFISNLCTSSSFIFILLSAVFYAFVFIWARGSLPRLRYDQLMSLS